MTAKYMPTGMCVHVCEGVKSSADRILNIHDFQVIADSVPDALEMEEIIVE